MKRGVKSADDGDAMSPFDGILFCFLVPWAVAGVCHCEVVLCVPLRGSFVCATAR